MAPGLAEGLRGSRRGAGTTAWGFNHGLELGNASGDQRDTAGAKEKGLEKFQARFTADGLGRLEQARHGHVRNLHLLGDGAK